MALYTVGVRNCCAYLRKPSHSAGAEAPCLPPRVTIHLSPSIGSTNAPQVLAGASANVKRPFQSVGAVGGIEMSAVVYWQSIPIAVSSGGGLPIDLSTARVGMPRPE